MGWMHINADIRLARQLFLYIGSPLEEKGDTSTLQCCDKSFCGQVDGGFSTAKE